MNTKRLCLCLLVIIIALAACARGPEVVSIPVTVIVTHIVTVTPAFPQSTPIADSPKTSEPCEGKVVILTGGVNDNFDPTNGQELAEINDTLAQFLQERDGNVKTLRNFDETKPNHAFAHTFENLSPRRDRICSAGLEIRVKPDGDDNPADDSLALGFAVNPSSYPFVWERHYETQPDNTPGLFESHWEPDSPAVVITLYLGDLPLADSGPTSFIELLNEYNFLDVYTNDDTAVDYVTLTVRYAVGEATATPTPAAFPTPTDFVGG